MKEVPVPTESRCPYCGGEPHDSPEHRLSALGYLHDDVKMTCTDCSKQWFCGVPIGDPDEELWRDLWCPSCDSCFMQTKNVEVPDNGVVKLHMKCPNEECYYFTKISRTLDKNGRALIGYPSVTGNTRDAEPFGW